MAANRFAAPLPRSLPALPEGSWLAAGAVAAALFAVASLSGHRAVFAAGALGCIAAGVALHEPRTIGPMLALALPLEISKLWFPFLQTRSELGGGLPPTSVVDAGRLVVALAFVVWLVRPARPRREVLPASPLTLPLALLFAVYASSTLYAVDVAAARTESLRLLFSLGGFALLPFFVRDRASLRWTLLAVAASMAALSLVAMYQGVTGQFFWNDGLGRFGERRVNTFFADPNHFARFLIEGIVVALLMWRFFDARIRRALISTIALAVVALIVTGSRASWIIGVVAIPVAVLAMPIARRARVRVLAIGGAGLLAAALVLAALSPFFSKRLDTFTFGVEASGARPYLVKAGLNMFADHPLTGVGAGGYQQSFQDDYYGYRDPKIKANITISHTSLVTLMAELGAIGLVALAFLVARWGSYVRTLLRTEDRECRSYVAAAAIASAVIFLGSQSEGRFLEDPYLWFFAGIAVAVEAVAAHKTSGGRAAT